MESNGYLQIGWLQGGKDPVHIQLPVYNDPVRGGFMTYHRFKGGETVHAHGMTSPELEADFLTKMKDYLEQGNFDMMTKEQP